MQNSWFHQLWHVVQVVKLQSRLRPSHYHHHVWLLYDVLFMKCCVGFTSDVTGHTPSKKFTFCLISPHDICPKILGIIKIFFSKCETSLCVRAFLVSSGFCLGTLPWMPYSLILNTELNWGKWSLPFFRCYSGFFFDLLDELSLCYWSNFGRPATPDKVPYYYKCSPFVDNGSDCGSLESQSFRNGFITLSWLIHLFICSSVLEFL